MVDVSWDVYNTSTTTVTGTLIKKTSGGDAYDSGGYQSSPLTTLIPDIEFSDFNAGNVNAWAGIAATASYTSFDGIWWRQVSSDELRIMSYVSVLIMFKFNYKLHKLILQNLTIVT